MGMFAKDKQFGRRLDTTVGLNNPFVLLDAYLTGDNIPTVHGDAAVARLSVCRITGEHPDPATGEMVPTLSRPLDCYTVASAIVDKIKDAEPDDFPAIVELDRVTSRNYDRDALVVVFLAPHTGPAPAAPARNLGGKDKA